MDTKAFVENHVKLLAEGDADRLVDNDYHDEAVMLLMIGDVPQVVNGKEALKGQVAYYLKNIYRGTVSVEKLLLTEDSISLEATIDTTGGLAKVWDALFMKDGKIFRHCSGMK